MNPNTSKSSRVMYTLFGTGTCSSISSFSLQSLSIITTSPLRRSPSIFASSSFFRHDTATLPSCHPSLAVFRRTVLVSHTPFRFTTMTSPVVALVPQENTPSSHMHVNLSKRASCLFTFPQDSSADDKPRTFPDFPFLVDARAPFCRGRSHNLSFSIAACCSDQFLPRLEGSHDDPVALRTAHHCS